MFLKEQILKKGKEANNIYIRKRLVVLVACVSAVTRITARMPVSSTRMRITVPRIRVRISVLTYTLL